MFEPNDETLWSLLRKSIGRFLQGLYSQGAFEGSSVDQAFFVKVDATTTTQRDIDEGVVNIVVGIAPSKPAEFIVLTIKQLTGPLDT